MRGPGRCDQYALFLYCPAPPDAAPTPAAEDADVPTPAPWCPVAATVGVIGGKWKPTILFYLKDGPRRFNELRRLVPGITQRMLTAQLRALEADGVVERTARGGAAAPHVEYAFAARGLTLGPLLDAMEAWGEAHGPRAPRRPTPRPAGRP